MSAQPPSDPVDPMQPVLTTVSAPDSEDEAVLENEAKSTAISDPEHPYAIITNRNVFQLTEPPKPVEPSPELTVPTIKMTGLVKMSGQPTHALFVSAPKDPKEQIVYFNLAEGERQDALEVVKILENEEAAEVINSGTKMTIKLKDSIDNKLAAGQNPANPLAARNGAPGTVPPPPIIPSAQQPEEQQTTPSRSGVMVVGGNPTPAPAAPAAAVPGPGQLPTQEQPATQRLMPRPLRIPPPK